MKAKRDAEAWSLSGTHLGAHSLVPSYQAWENQSHEGKTPDIHHFRSSTVSEYDMAS